jgi:hypothetical protein
MPRFRPTLRASLAAFALVAGVAWIPATAVAQPSGISIVSDGPDGSGNPYDLTIVANDSNAAALTSMTAHLSQGSTDVFDVPMKPVNTTDPTNQTWIAASMVPAVDLPAGSYTVTVDAADGTETDNGLAAPSPLTVTYSATTINVTPSRTFVTEGSQNVTFSGTVTGTAQDGQNTQVPLGNVTVKVSDGNQTTTSAGGAFSYTASGLAQSTSFDFTVAAAGDGSYPSGDSGSIPISVQQAATSISVTPSPANISQGSGPITFNGQVTAVPAGGGSAVPVPGAAVSLSVGGGPTISVGSTGSDGSFSYVATGLSAATDFNFSVPGSNLYGAASKDVSIGLVQSATSVTVTPSQAFVTQGANNVTFGGQVTVTPPGGGPAVPIGGGVAVQVSGGATATVTTDSSGDFSYTATGLTAASTSFTFSVSGTTLYTSAATSVSIPAEQAATAITVTPTQGTIELGSQNVTFNGQVTITPPAPGGSTPAAQSIGPNVPVTITGGSFSTTVITGANGGFSVPVSGIAVATNFTFSIAATNLYGSGSSAVQIQAAAPATTAIVMANPGVITFGTPGVNLTGTVTAINASSTTLPVSGASVFLNGGTSPVATTNGSGQFTYPVSGITANTTYTFSVNADPNNLYTAASTPAQVNVTPGQTAVTIQTNPAFVNGGPQPVTFTVTVNVTPAGTGASAQPIGAGVPVMVSVDGGIPAAAGTTDSSGVLTDKVKSVLPGDDYDFTVASGTLHTAAEKDFAFGKQSTTLTVTPSRPSVTEGSQNVTFSGTVTGVVASSSAPIQGAAVSLTVNSSSSSVATTDANGHFSYTAKGVSRAGTYQFSVVGTNTYTPGSASVAIGLTPAQTRITVIKPSALKYGQRAALRGTVQYKSGTAWIGLPGARVHLAEGKTSLGSVVASNTGKFTAKLPTTHGFAWKAQLNAAVLTQQATIAGNLSIAMPLKVGTFSAALGTDGAVHTSGCLVVTAPVRFSPMSTIQLQYATSSRGKWHLLGKLQLHNSDRKAKGCSNPNQSFFTGAMRAASDNAYYRVMFPATSSFQSAVSKTIHSARTQTKITSYAVSPRTLKTNQIVTITGRLWHLVGKTWKAYAGRSVQVIYNVKGTSYWSNLGNPVVTNSRGDFTMRAKGGVGSFTVIMYAGYAGSRTDLATRSAGIAVAIKQSGAVTATAPGGAQPLAAMIAANGPESAMLMEQNLLILGLAPAQIAAL